MILELILIIQKGLLMVTCAIILGVPFFTLEMIVFKTRGKNLWIPKPCPTILFHMI